MNADIDVVCRYCGQDLSKTQIVCANCYQELKEEIAALKEIINGYEQLGERLENVLKEKK